MAFAGQPPPHFQDLQAFCTAPYASFLSLSSKSPLIASRNTENFCRFEVWHTLTEFICGHPTRLTSYLFLILEAAGGTSKGSLGLRWSIWQKLLGKPRSGFSALFITFAEGFKQTSDAFRRKNRFPSLLQFCKFNHQNDPTFFLQREIVDILDVLVLS